MITEFISYLQGAGLTPSVKYAFTSEPVEEYSDELPTIMVYPLSYSASESLADNLVIQDTQIQVACLLGCAIGSYESLLDELRAAAIGWVTGYHDAMELAGAEIVGLKGGYIWWREVYTTRIRIRQST